MKMFSMSRETAYDGSKIAIRSLLQVWAYPPFPLVLKNDSRINDIQKRWIESKVRNSMLITKTTNIRQIEIFRNIYQQVSELGITNYELIKNYINQLKK